MSNMETFRRMMLMGASLTAAATLAAALPDSPPTPALSIARIAAERNRTLAMPHQCVWAPDGKRLACLRTIRTPGHLDHGNPTPDIVSAEIWALDVATAQENLLLSRAQLTAALNTNRPRALQEEESAIRRYQLQSFAWSHDGHSLLLASASDLFWYNLDSHTFRTLASTKSEDDDSGLSSFQISSPQISPDGTRVSFIRHHALEIADIASATAQPFTPPAKDDLWEGQPDWAYDHDFALHTAYWWSPDASSIAWLETDDRAVAKYSMRDSTGEEHAFAYPLPGKAIPAIHLFVQPLAGGKPTSIDLGADPNVYIPSVQWLPDAKHLAIQRLSRNQKTLELLLADPATGQSQVILTEKDTYWINLGQPPFFLKDSHRFLWTSERSGYRHLYLYDTAGHQLAQLTQGDSQVTSLDAVDEQSNTAYFTSTETTPLERQLYRVHLDGSGAARVTQTKGTHTSSFSPAADLFLDTFSDRATEPRLSIVRADGKELTSLPELPGAVPSSQLSPPEFFILKTHMGLPLNASIIKPPDFDPAKKYPVIVYTAGGPGEQAVRDIWGGDIALWFSFMAHKGYIVFALDNRGTGARGHLFEEPIHLRLSGIEMADVRDGVLYLRSQPWVDASRIGICGWGYGGFLAIHGMLDRPLIYKAGFAGSAVVDWRHYDALFAERYLEDPVLNQDGWLSSSPLENAPNLRGALLIAQATLDEQVHPENPYMLLDELLDSGHYADILLFPDRRDLFEEQNTRQVLFQRLTDFFLKNL